MIKNQNFLACRFWTEFFGDDNQLNLWHRSQSSYVVKSICGLTVTFLLKQGVLAVKSFGYFKLLVQLFVTTVLKAHEMQWSRMTSTIFYRLILEEQSLKQEWKE